MNYSENLENPRRGCRRLNDHQKEIAAVTAELEIKRERISNMKTALYSMNKQHDKYDIKDVEEYDDLISEDEGEDETDSSNIAPSTSESNDVIEINENENNAVIRTGVEPLQTDYSLSMEYSFITDVHNNRHYTHCDIELTRVTVDTLNKWNRSKPSIVQDTKFLKLLLVDIFKTKLLKESNLTNLDDQKIRFIRGTFSH